MNNNHEEVVELLLGANADVDIKNMVLSSEYLILIIIRQIYLPSHWHIELIFTDVLIF